MPDGAHDVAIITSGANPLVKLARQLASRRRARHREGLFLMEGERVISTAIRNGTDIQTILIDEERRESISPALYSSLLDAASRIVTASAPIFASVSDAEHPQSLIAIGRIPRRNLPEQASSVVVLDAVRDPGNLGTIVRTACAAGVDGIALLPGCVDPFNPKVVRASAGMVTGIAIQSVKDIPSLLDQAFAHPNETLVIAADAAGSTDFRDVDWKKPHVLVIGNEASGLSAASREVTTHFARIPMESDVESLNVSAATAVLLMAMRNARTGR